MSLLNPKQCAPLDRELELELFRQARAGCHKARRRVIMSCAPYAVKLAAKHRHTGVDLDDAIANAYLGLTEAFSKFDESRNCRFISHAHWYIIKRIKQPEDSTINVRTQGHVSMQASVGPDTPATVEDRIRRANPIDNLMGFSPLDLRKALSAIPGRKREVTVRYYGLDGRAPETFAEIAKRRGQTHQGIQLVNKRVIGALRKRLSSEISSCY